ncbi:DinB family protein [Bacillus sp. X1(2014)]|uniref:DinB family protein n=1 Tax=Bacillus sp. X1(2014) TaxID=1565991 RepID=UPI00119CD3CE|nr:DinB family protein [Bacillus sp. X1(2014)]
MNEKMLFDQFEFARNVTLKVVQGITEENADIIPSGYSNSLRWQLGHIYVSVEGIVFHFANETPNLPEGYMELFNTGTNPTDWKTIPPTIEEILPLLSEQVKRVKETFSGRLDEKIAQPLPIGPLKLETIGELLSFASFHESEHIGIIKSLKNALKEE